jgi:hypothetical protein
MRACRRFFELNPLGQLGLVVLREGIAEKLTDLSGSPEAQIEQLQQYGLDTGKGVESCLLLLARGHGVCCQKVYIQ